VIVKPALDSAILIQYNTNFNNDIQNFMKDVLTQPLVDKLRKEGARVEVWDTKLSNFFLQVRESGAGTFYIRYTLPPSNAKQSYRLGDAGVLPVTQARAMAQALLARIALGFDPMEDKRQAKACPTLEDVVTEHYLPYIKLTKKSWDTDDCILRCHILPVLGKKTLAAITTSDIESLMQTMRVGGRFGSAKGRARTRDVTDQLGYAPATCNRVAVLLRYLFNLAIDKWKLPGVARNPAAKVRQFEVNNIRQVFLSPEQVGQLIEAGRPKPGQQNPMTLQIVMFLVLTGVRKSNSLKARWREFDEARGLWQIPVTKSGKPQTLQLSQEVLNLLQTLPSRGESDYLFPNPNTRMPFVTVYSSWNSMRKEAGLSHVRMHDLRHTFASLLVNGGASLFMVQNALGHSNPKITMRYAHLADQTQRLAIQNAANQLSGFLPPMRANQPQQVAA
jgi:integrase